MEYLSDSINIYTDDEKAVEKTLIGILLTLGTVFIVPLFLLYGYFVQILVNTETPGAQYPDWDNWGQLLVRGLLSSVIAFVLYIPTQGIMYIPDIMRLAGRPISTTASIIFISIGLLLTLISWYFLPVIFAMIFRENGEITDIKRLFKISFSKDYFLTYTLIGMLGFVFGIIVIILLFATFGLIFFALPFIQFPIQIITFYMLGAAITQGDPKSQATTSETQTTEAPF